MQQNPAVLNIASFLKNTTIVGPGLRDAVWTQGCSIGCPGCSNQSYQPHERRVLISVERLKKHFKSRVGKIDGISVLGGEPTEQIEAVVQLLKEVKMLGLTSVVFTGLLLEQLHKESQLSGIIEYTDLLIDGPFIENLSDPSLHWRGSRNQRLILLRNPWNVSEVKQFFPKMNGEILISGSKVQLYGVGTQSVSHSFDNFNNSYSLMKNFPMERI